MPRRKADGNPIFDDTIVTEPIIGPYGEPLLGGDGAQFNISTECQQSDAGCRVGASLLTPEVFLPISLISAGLFLPAYENIYALDEVVAAFDADPDATPHG